MASPCAMEYRIDPQVWEKNQIFTITWYVLMSYLLNLDLPLNASFIFKSTYIR